LSRIDEALRRYHSGNEALPPVAAGPSPQPQARSVPPRAELVAPSPDELIDLRLILWVLWHRKRIILAIAAAVVLPVAVYNALTVPLYRSSALVQIDPEPVQVLPYREIGVPTGTQNYDMFMKSQGEILAGSTILLRAAERVRLADEPAMKEEMNRLHQRFNSEWIPLTQIFRLSYAAPDPKVAATMANMFAEEYIKLHFETRQGTREKARELLKRELENLERQVQASEKELVAYAQGHDIPANQGDVSLVPDKLATLNKELTAAEADVFAAQARVDSLRQASVETFPEQLVTANIAALVSRLLALEHELTALRTNFGENWPAVVQKRQEIALVREQLVQEKASSLRQAREQASINFTTADNKRKLLSTSVSGQEQLVHKLESATIQYNILRREVDTNQKMYEGLLQRLQQTSLTTGMEFGGFHVIEKALPSDQPFSPRIVWNLTLASVLGLALGICFVGVRHFWTDSVSTIEDVEHLTVLPVLGTLPQVSEPPSLKSVPPRKRGKYFGSTDGAPSLLASFDRSSAQTDAAAGEAIELADDGSRPGSNLLLTEYVRNVCASILLSRSGRPPRLLMITSAVTGDGKTTVATELAHAFADSGKKTLLIECDMRRPSLGPRFGIKPDGGLSMFLSGLVARPVMHTTQNSNLFIVSAGPNAPNPATLIGSDKMRTFLHEMLGSFQFVILDAPPVVPVAESRILAHMAEGVVLVVRAGVTPRTLVRRVCALLETAGANLLGAVLNGAHQPDLHGQYYSHYNSDQEQYPS
jgi:capsular exopolysaccharide synthesis family protein